jgi:hypothetical protein
MDNSLNGGTNGQAPISATVNVNNFLTQEQLNLYANHDLVLIIDKSSSMLTPDCASGNFANVGTFIGALLGPAGGANLSRWNWCKAQTQQLAQLTSSVCKQGFTVIIFSSTFRVYHNVTLNQVPTIFREERPTGGTRLAQPLRAPIGDYFARRDKSGGKVKPLAIAIISDGNPNDEQNVRKAIFEATQYMKSPGEITITFFMIGGGNAGGNRFVSDLVNNQVQYGAKYPLVRAVPFSVLAKVGLARALADAMQ